MTARLRRWWSRVEPHVGTRQSLLVLVAIALLVYGIEAAAWPLAKGRDMWDYLAYYLSLPDTRPVYSDLMLFRTPVTPLVLGIPLSLGGVTTLEVVFGVLYAVTIAAWAAAGLQFGRLTALVAAVVVLAYPGLATLYHQASSDAVFATGFALWSLGVAVVLRRPSWGGFAWLGAGVAVLVLTRPASQILVLAVLLPFLVPLGWRARGVSAAAFLAAAMLPLAVWAGVNAARYDDFAVARGGNAWVPFFRVFLDDRAVDPANGEDSRRLGAAIEREVLTRPAFRALDVDLETYLQGGSNFEAIRLVTLSDRVFGRDTDYAVLRGAAFEAVRAEPGEVLGSMAWNVWDFLRYRGTRDPVQRQATTFPPQPATITAANGQKLPSPWALSPLLEAVRMGMVWCPTDDYERCVLDDPAVVYPDPGDQRRYREVTDRIGDWNAAMPSRDGVDWIGTQLNRIAWRFPTPPWWLLLAAVGLAWRRPAAWRTVVALVAAGLAIVVVHAVSQLPAPEFALPVYPAFIVGGIAAVTAPRRRGRR